MNNDEKYDLIFNILLNSTGEDWERFAQQFPDFPNGLDRELFKYDCGQIYQLGTPWITNAIDCASFECVKWMIAKGVNLHYKAPGGYFPLHSCIDREFPDKYEMLQLLIDNGADVNVGTNLDAMAINSWSPLHMAACRNDLEAIKILLDNGADITLRTTIDNYCTAEQEAVILGKQEAAELIRTYKSKAK